jgi:hypothetical protein
MKRIILIYWSLVGRNARGSAKRKEVVEEAANRATSSTSLQEYLAKIMIVKKVQTKKTRELMEQKKVERFME